MILLISLILDAALLAVKAVRKRNVMTCLRFLSMSVLINTFAYYMILGLTKTFGSHFLFALVCSAAAKIFVIWLCLQSAEAGRRNAPVYLLVILLSLCLHSNPLPGLISEALLLLFVLYTEHCGDTNSADASETHPKRASDIYLQTIEDSYRKNRALMHDLKNHIIVLRTLAEQKEYGQLLDYTNSMEEKVSENLFPVHSGSIILDALLADKYHTARRNGIFVEFRDIRYNADFDGGDLCIVIGNLFDNAIAENLKNPRAEERHISVAIRSTDEELTVIIQNPLFHVLKIQNGLPVSDKPDLEHHGIGLRNVRRVCDAYGGTLLWNDEDGIFTATAQLKMTRNP